MMKQFFSSLKTVNKTAFFILALLCAVVQGAWATVTTYNNGIFTGFTATAGSHCVVFFDYSNLVDASIDSETAMVKANPTYIEFYSSGYIVPTGYIITSEAHASYNPEDTPQRWAVMAKVNETDTEWTTIAYETINTAWTLNSHAYEFNIPGNTTAYKYFRLEFYENRGGKYYNLSSFQFKGTTTDLFFGALSNVNPYYELPPSSSSSISPVVKDCNGTTLTLGTDFTATLNDVAVTEFPINISTLGSYTLTVTGKGSYVGSRSASFGVYTTLSGDGTEGNPYLISSEDDWNSFANKVNNGNSYSGQFVKLTNNISVTTMVGTSSANSFQGTFDGGGKTLTFNRGTSSQPLDENCCAPFRIVKNATIKNLKTAGNIYTTIYSSFSAGLIGQVSGTNPTNIINCQVGSVILSPGGANGGIVGGVLFSALNITGCTFTGRLLTNNGSSPADGGFVGFSITGDPINITNSLYAPGSIPEGWTAVNSGFPFVNGSTVIIDNCYFTEPMGTAQGKQAYSITPGENATVENVGTATEYNVSGITSYDTGIKYNGVLYAGDGDNVNLKLGYNRSGYIANGYQASAGTLSGSANPYTLTMPAANVTISVSSWYEGLKPDGSGDYLINSENDWETFCTMVSLGGDSFSGKTVKLTKDISVSTMVGTSYANSFQGTFDGDGNTLTVNYNTTENNAAPFSHVRNATIKNLRVAGTITTSAPFAGGIVSESHEALTLTGCISSVAINSSKSGDGTHAGLVSVLSGRGNAILIDGCVFDGSFATTTGTVGCGGFIGWGVYNKPTIKNSLLKPGSVDANMLGSNFARWHTGDEGIYEPTFTNCYYVATANLPTDQGTKPCSVTAGNYVTVSNISPVGSSTATYSVSGITAYAKGISYGGTFYYGSGDQVGLTLANNAPTPGQGQSYIYTASAGTLTGSENPYTLTLPNDGDVTIGITAVASDWASAAGTAEDPYKIYNKEQLDMLATRVNNGTTYSGAYFKLMNDIEYDPASSDNYTAIGVSGHAFCGDFNGDGHTISGIRINKNTDYQGLFGLTGTGANIHGIILTDARITGADNVGGIVGSNGGTLSDNFITGTTVSASGNNYGAICGQNNEGTLQRNYYLSCTVAGTQNATDVGCNKADVTGAKAAYTITAGEYVSVENAGTTGIIYGDVLYAGSGDVVSLTLSNNRSLLTGTGYKASQGTLTGSGNPYTLTMPTSNVTISVTSWAPNAFSGTGTPGDPYLITNATDWDNLVYYVNSGTVAGFYGKHLKLTNNIEVTTMVGLDGNHTFRGTFDGDGNTITVNYTTTEQYAAPFLYTYGCTIKNLKTAGIINTSSQNAGGVVGRNGTANITLINVSSSVTINSSYVGSGYHGGLVGYAINASFEGCAFTGSLLGASSHHCGGLLGQKSNTDKSSASFTNCFFAPTEVIVGPGLSFTFAAGARNLTSFNNCYYTEKLGGEQGLGYSFDIKPVNIGTEGTPYSVSGITPYTHGLLYNGSYYMTPVAMSLANNADNSTTISDADGHFTTVTLTDRTLYKDGAWNTICLPFDVTLAGSPLAGAEARQLTAASISGTTLNLTFSDVVTTLVAGTPYIIKWTKADGYDQANEDTRDIKNPVFYGVTIDATDRSYDTQPNSVTTDERVRFLGTYDALTFTASDANSILLLGGENTLHYAGEGAHLGACRAYFKIGDGTNAARITSFDIDFGEGETTGVSDVRSKMADGRSDIYDMQGRKVANGQKPTAKGLYIVNGKKVIVK